MQLVRPEAVVAVDPTAGGPIVARLAHSSVAQFRPASYAPKDYSERPKDPADSGMANSCSKHIAKSG